MNDFDIGIIGAGIVGLAIARALALEGRSVIVLEKENAFGIHGSARNSEVIHAGIYYPKDSLKAKLCVTGKTALYEFCAKKSVPFKRCGKHIVATDESEIAGLHAIKEKAEANDVPDLVWQMPEATPEIQCTASLFSPSTGIVDSHALMSALLGEGEDAGAVLALNASVEKVTDRFVIHTRDAAIRVGAVVNSAGLWAQNVAAEIEALDPKTIPPVKYARGHYARLKGVTHSAFPYLVYPVPVAGGLGTHITIDMAGQIRFGPDVEWIEAIDYAYPLEREKLFYDSIRRYWPSLPDGCLTPDYTGIRPKIDSGDFMIENSVSGLVNLYGIESPGLTACLSIAENIVDIL